MKKNVFLKCWQNQIFPTNVIFVVAKGLIANADAKMGKSEESVHCNVNIRILCECASSHPHICEARINTFSMDACYISVCVYHRWWYEVGKLVVFLARKKLFYRFQTKNKLIVNMMIKSFSFTLKCRLIKITVSNPVNRIQYQYHTTSSYSSHNVSEYRRRRNWNKFLHVGNNLLEIFKLFYSLLTENTLLLFYTVRVDSLHLLFHPFSTLNWKRRCRYECYALRSFHSP